MTFKVGGFNDRISISVVASPMLEAGGERDR